MEIIDIFAGEISRRILENNETLQALSRRSESFSDEEAVKYLCEKFSRLDVDTDAIAAQLGIARSHRQARKFKTATQLPEDLLNSRGDSREFVLSFRLLFVYLERGALCEQSVSSLQLMKFHLRSTARKEPFPTSALLSIG